MPKVTRSTRLELKDIYDPMISYKGLVALPKYVVCKLTEPANINREHRGRSSMSWNSKPPTKGEGNVRFSSYFEKGSPFQKHEPE